jgi:hypothetical protein
MLDLAAYALNHKRNAQVNDPVLVVFWNEERVHELSMHRHNPKRQIQQSLENLGVERMQPMPENFFFFREPSLFAECEEQMKMKTQHCRFRHTLQD